MFRRDALFSLLVRAFFVMAGFQIVWAIALEVGPKMVNNFMAVYPGQLLVDPSGQLVFERFDDGQPQYRATDGKPVAVPEQNYWLSGAGLFAPLSEKERSRRLAWPQRLNSVTDYAQSRTSWFLVHSEIIDGQGYLVGYNQISKAQVGYLARDGFRTTLPPRDQWFSIVGAANIHRLRHTSSYRQSSGKMIYSGSIDRHDGTYLVSGGQVWRLDLAGRSVEVLYPSTDAVSVWTSPIVIQAAAREVPDDWSGGPYYVLSGAGLLVRTPTEVIGVDFDGRKRTSWTIPEKLRSQYFIWYELADGTALASVQRSSLDATWADYYWIDEQGNITREEEVRFEPKPPPSRMYWAIAAVVPQTFLATLISGVITPIMAVERGLQPDFPTAVAQSIADGWAALLAVYVLSLALAALAYRRQTRFALPGQVAWTMFVFLFGLPGWLAYRWHRRWPVLEPCGECRQPAPRDRATCAACGQLFAPPPLGRTEIYA